MRHQVFTAMGLRREWWGVDFRIFLAAGALFCLMLLYGPGMLTAFASFLLVAGAGKLLAKYDGRFLTVIPIVVRLRARRYEAGR